MNSDLRCYKHVYDDYDDSFVRII